MGFTLRNRSLESSCTSTVKTEIIENPARTLGLPLLVRPVVSSGKRENLLAVRSPPNLKG